MHTRELSDFTFFIFKTFTVSVLQRIDEDKKKKKRMLVNILGKKFKVTKNTQ